MHLVRSAWGTLDRRGLEQALSDLVSGTSSNLTQLETLGIPAPSPRAAQLLQDTLDERARGSRDLAGAVSLAIGPDSAGEVATRAGSLIVQAGKEYVTGDKDYRSFVLSLPRDAKPGRLGASRWVTDPQSWGSAAATDWAERLSGIPKLQVHQDLVIVALTVQPPVVRITGLPTTTTTTTTAPATTTTTTTTTPGGHHLDNDLDHDLDLDNHDHDDDADPAFGLDLGGTADRDALGRARRGERREHEVVWRSGPPQPSSLRCPPDAGSDHRRRRVRPSSR